jgi:hypothetical protein
MEGTEGRATCTLSAIIPADQFRAFHGRPPKDGKVQSERITASKLRPGQAEGTAVAGGPDPRELSLVSIRMADEKVAQTVLESRGVPGVELRPQRLPLMKGLAVIVELFGLALPFCLALALWRIPALVVLKVRRARLPPSRALGSGRGLIYLDRGRKPRETGARPSLHLGGCGTAGAR